MFTNLEEIKMYKRIKKENGWYDEFDGDFDQYLLNIGVSEDHIAKMKEKILEGPRDNYYGNYEHPALGITELVPLEKVIGTSRGSVGQSVYENVRKMNDGARRYDKFTRCFNFLNSMALDELRKSYENLHEPVPMTYYKDEDVYYLTSDGNHRTLTAMLLGASHIKARVSIAHCDYEKKKKYFACREFYKKYSIYKILTFSFSEYHIVFSDSGMKYAVRGFERLDSEESCFEVIARLSEEIDKDLYYRHLLCRLPEALRKFALIFIDEKVRKRLKYYPDIAEVDPISEDYYADSNIVNLYDSIHNHGRIPRPFLK